MSLRIENYALEKVCSKDETRPALCQPYFDGRRLMATNGCALAVVPCESDEGTTDTPGPVPLEAFKLARKERSLPVLFLENGNARIIDGRTFPRPDCGTYPNVDYVIPKLDADALPDICLDADLLAALAAAVCTARERKVKLYFQRSKDGSINPAGAIVVKPANEAGGAFGVIIPVRAAF